MLEIKTPLSKIHRPVRPVRDGYLGNYGTWGYIDSDGFINQIASTSTNQSQAKVLKLFINRSMSTRYESHDVKVGRIATLEGLYRAAVNSDGYQVNDTLGNPITYNVGDRLSPAYNITSSPTTDTNYADATDIGKLRPSTRGETVVAHVENLSGGVLTFRSITPQPYGVDPIWNPAGAGSMVAGSDVIDGVGNSLTEAEGTGDLVAPADITDGVGDASAPPSPAPDIGPYEYV